MNKELLNLLACPQCHASLEENSQPLGLSCKKCKLVYPIIDDIPVVLVEKAIAFNTILKNQNPDK